MNHEIRTRMEEGVFTITFNRLGRKNAITAAMYEALAAALAGAEADPAVRAAVLEGHESVFTAGNDLGDFLQHTGASEPSAYAFMRALAKFPKPLIAAVCGPAVGIGTTMLLHCDLVYAGDDAVFSMPFVDLGLCPEAASSLLLPRLFGHHRAAAALLLAEPLDARAAFEAGLVNKVLPAPEVNASGPAAKEAISAFLEKRRPDFSTY